VLCVFHTARATHSTVYKLAHHQSQNLDDKKLSYRRERASAVITLFKVM